MLARGRAPCEGDERARLDMRGGVQRRFADVGLLCDAVEDLRALKTRVLIPYIYIQFLNAKTYVEGGRGFLEGDDIITTCGHGCVIRRPCLCGSGLFTTRHCFVYCSTHAIPSSLAPDARCCLVPRRVGG